MNWTFVELNCSLLKWSELNFCWTELKFIVLKWIELFVELYWSLLYWIEVYWTEVNFVEPMKFIEHRSDNRACSGFEFMWLTQSLRRHCSQWLPTQCKRLIDPYMTSSCFNFGNFFVTLRTEPDVTNNRNADTCQAKSAITVEQCFVISSNWFVRKSQKNNNIPSDEWKRRISHLFRFR